MTTLARVPYARLAPPNAPEVDRELQKIERFSTGLFVPLVLVSARSPYSIKGTEWLILCDCTAGAITLTFPLAARVDGLFVTVVKTDATANAVTLSGTFSGVVNPTLTAQHATRIIQAGNGVYEMSPKASDLAPGTLTGDFTIVGTLTATRVHSGGNVVTAPNATATTMFALSQRGRTDVVAYINGLGSPFQAIATLTYDGSSAYLQSTVSQSVNFALSLSGTNVQVTQSSGGPLDVTFSYTAL